MTRPKATEFDRRFGEKLREVRIAYGMTQMEMTGPTGVSYQQVHKREHGINRTPISSVAALRTEFGISIDAIIDEINGGPPASIIPPALVDALAAIENAARLIPDLRAAVNGRAKARRA